VALPDTAAALAPALVELLRHEPLRRQWGAAALARARLDMDPLRAAHRTAALYAEVLADEAAT
jgi:hypothetical protein